MACANLPISKQWRCVSQRCPRPAHVGEPAGCDDPRPVYDACALALSAWPAHPVYRTQELQENGVMGQ